MAVIYGDNTAFEEVRVDLKALMDNLKTAMDTAETDPRPAVIYDGHEQSIMSFPAVSVGIAEEGIEVLSDDTGISQTAATIPQDIVVEIRVHTDYDDDGSFVDEIKVFRLLNSVSNYVKTNALSYLNTNMSGCPVVDLELAEIAVESESFDESLTVGGYFKFRIRTVFNHTQA